MMTVLTLADHITRRSASTQMRIKLTAPLKIKVALFRTVRPSIWLSMIPLSRIWRRVDWQNFT